MGQNSYDEGSGVAALNIARFSGSAVRGVIGVAAGSLNKAPLKDEYTYRANIAVGADTSGLLNPTLNTTLGGYSSSVTTASAGSAFVQMGLYGTVKVADSAYAYAGVSVEARTGQTLYGGSVGLRMGVLISARPAPPYRARPSVRGWFFFALAHSCKLFNS